MDVFATIKEKSEAIRNEVAWKAKCAKDWVVHNKDELIHFAPIIIAGATTITKVVGRRVNLHKEQQVKELYCYDRSLGHYWRLRRDLTNKEWLEIAERKSNGERLADILAEMRVLK